MPSKPVIRRQRIDNALRSILTQHEEALLEGLRERLGPLLGEGEVLESYDKLHRFFLELLDARERSLVEADEAHLAELMDDRAERRLRDRARSEVRDVLIGIRSAANGHFDRDQAAEFLNLEGLTSRDPVALPKLSPSPATVSKLTPHLPSLAADCPLSTQDLRHGRHIAGSPRTLCRRRLATARSLRRGCRRLLPPRRSSRSTCARPLHRNPGFAGAANGLPRPGNSLGGPATGIPMPTAEDRLQRNRAIAGRETATRRCHPSLAGPFGAASNGFRRSQDLRGGCRV